jgi:hypothetical protein
MASSLDALSSAAALLDSVLQPARVMPGNRKRAAPVPPAPAEDDVVSMNALAGLTLVFRR